MALLLKLMTIFMLQVGVSLAGFIPQFDMKFKRVGEDVLLKCDLGDSSNQCSNTTWLFFRLSNDRNRNMKPMIFEENADQSSVGASRLSLRSNCSLLIRNLTAEDGGVYACAKFVLLGILSITSSPPDVNGWVDLTCSLKGLDEPGHCLPYPIIWVDETGTQLSGNSPEFEVKNINNCYYVLTVKHQSGNNKRFTCQLIAEDGVKVDAVYILTE